MFLGRLFSNKPKVSVVEQKRIAVYRNLLKKEALIGGELFGPIPAGGRREFFCLDESTWVWHEEWIDQTGKHQIKNTRYDVRPSGILKAQNGQAYSKVSPKEAENLEVAIHAYVQRVKKDVYAVS